MLLDKQSLKPSVLSAVVLASSSFGDAFLYIALPLNAVQMNVPVVMIGFLLSVNRLVRLVANQLFGFLFNHYGYRTITILAAIFSVISTLMYGFATGMILWIIARIIWGCSFSALRLSAIGYSLQNKRQGLSLGLNKGLQELGPIVALIIGPILLQDTGPQTTFFIFALLSISAIIVSFFLPELKSTPMSYNFSYRIMPSSFDILTFMSSFIVQGILIVTITGLLANKQLSLTELTAMAGCYLAYRRICSVFISPFGGMFADRCGIDKIYIAALLLCVAGLFLIAVGFTGTGIIMAFTFNSINAAITPGNAIGGFSGHLKAVASNSTWSDIGAALGTLVGGFALGSFLLDSVFFIATFVLLLTAVIHIKSINFQTKTLLQWK